MGCASSSEAAAVPTPAPTQKPSGNGSAVQLKLHDEAASSSNVTNLAFKKRSSDLSDSGEITSERDEILGGGKQNKLMARAEKISMGVLPLLKSFERFDVDKSGGLSVDELRDALEDLGIVTTKEFATRVLQQYDQVSRGPNIAFSLWCHDHGRDPGKYEIPLSLSIPLFSAAALLRC